MTHDSTSSYMIQPTFQKLRAVVPPKAWQAPQAIRRELIVAVIEYGNDADHVVDMAEQYYKSPAGRGRFFLLPSNFLKDGHYDDDPAAWGERSAEPAEMKSSGALERARAQRLEVERERRYGR